MKDEGRRATNRRRSSHPPAPKPPRTTTSGISNQLTDEESASQARLPPRKVADEPSWTRELEDAEEGELVPQTVADVMTAQPTVLEATQTVSDAARAMRDGNIGNVLVTEGDQLVGIVTDRDLVVRVLAEGLDPSRTPLGTVCSRELTTVSPGDAIETAVARMRESAIRRLPVVEDGRLVGILALGDLAVEREPESGLGDINAAPRKR
jgi:CBS domain-containing protein